MSNATVSIEEYIDRLDGITYAQWAKLSVVMHRVMEEDVKDYKNKMSVNSSNIKRVYNSHFGGCSI